MTVGFLWGHNMLMINHLCGDKGQAHVTKEGWTCCTQTDENKDEEECFWKGWEEWRRKVMRWHTLLETSVHDDDYIWSVGKPSVTLRFSPILCKCNSLTNILDHCDPNKEPVFLYEECNLFLRSKLSEVRVESLFGPRPGTTVGEGSYNMLIRLVHNREQLTMCKYRYQVTGEHNVWRQQFAWNLQLNGPIRAKDEARWTPCWK